MVYVMAQFCGFFIDQFYFTLVRPLRGCSNLACRSSLCQLGSFSGISLSPIKCCLSCFFWVFPITHSASQRFTSAKLGSFLSIWMGFGKLAIGYNIARCAITGANQSRGYVPSQTRNPRFVKHCAFSTSCVPDLSDSIVCHLAEIIPC